MRKNRAIVPLAAGCHSDGFDGLWWLHALPCGLFFFGYNKVELPFLQIGTGHLYANRIAKLVLVMMPSSTQHKVFLVEVVVVVIQIVHGHHALAVIFVYPVSYTHLTLPTICSV